MRRGRGLESGLGDKGRSRGSACCCKHPYACMHGFIYQDRHQKRVTAYIHTYAYTSQVRPAGLAGGLSTRLLA